MLYRVAATPEPPSAAASATVTAPVYQPPLPCGPDRVAAGAGGDAELRPLVERVGAAGGHLAAVQLARQVGGVVGVEHRTAAAADLHRVAVAVEVADGGGLDLQRPDDAVAGAVGRDARR